MLVPSPRMAAIGRMKCPISVEVFNPPHLPKNSTPRGRTGDEQIHDGRCICRAHPEVDNRQSCAVGGGLHRLAFSANVAAEALGEAERCSRGNSSAGCSLRIHQSLFLCNAVASCVRSQAWSSSVERRQKIHTFQTCFEPSSKISHGALRAGSNIAATSASFATKLQSWRVQVYLPAFSTPSERIRWRRRNQSRKNRHAQRLLPPLRRRLEKHPPQQCDRRRHHRRR